MFFLLSKLLSIFLSPLTWIMLLLLLSAILKTRQISRKLLVTAIVIALLFSNQFLLDQFAKIWDVRIQAPANQNYSCAIILGGFVSADEHEQGYFNSASDRFIQGLKLVAQNRVSNVLISGGNASILKSKFQEADFVFTELKALNIPDSIILIENKARNTLENATLTKKLLETRHLEPPYLLVTSSFHMRRSLYTFKTAGLEVLPYPCDYKAGKSRTTLEDFLPSSGALNTWGYYIKEVIGYIVYYFRT